MPLFIFVKLYDGYFRQTKTTAQENQRYLTWVGGNVIKIPTNTPGALTWTWDGGTARARVDALGLGWQLHFQALLLTFLHEAQCVFSSPAKQFNRLFACQQMTSDSVGI